jgi:hypothetical protein
MAKKQVQDNSVKSQLDTSGLESIFATETANLKKRDALYEAANKRLQAQKQILDGINQSMKVTTNLTKEQVSKIQNTVDAWAKAESVQSKALNDYKKGDISAKKYKQTIQEITKEFDNARKGVKLTGKENKELRKTISSMRDEMKSFGKAVDDSAKSIGFMDTALDQIGSSGIPMMKEFSDVLKNAGKNANATKIALTAAGAAAALLAKNYFLPDMKATQDVENEVKQMRTDNIADLARIENKRATTIIEDVKNKSTLEKKIGLEISQNSIDTTNEVNRLNVDAAYASQRAANQFSATMKSGAAEFQASAKTALYGKGIGSIGYGAAQMQLAGVGAENVAASLTTATKALGTKVSSDFAADMSVLEKRTGQSSENISGMVSFFRRMGKLTNESALNMTEGMRAMADSAGIDLGGYMEEVAQASKEALGYQIKSGPALQKQVAYAQQLGVSFGDIAKAGKSMVLNYKDSIKKEMELSAMLGKNVNLSEARALFAQGKTDDALKSIKAQGLDPSKMNMFQQEALSQALGGLDLDSIQKIATGSAKDVSAQTGNVKAGNKGFLSATQSAQATLSSQQANIQAQQAIIDAKLSGEITKAYLNSDGYKTYQNSLIDQEKQAMKVAQEEELRFKKSKDYLAQLIATAKNNIESAFSKDNFANIAVGVVGAAGGNILGSVIENFRGEGNKTSNKKRTRNTPGKKKSKIANLLSMGSNLLGGFGGGGDAGLSNEGPMPVTIVDGGPLQGPMDGLKDMVTDKITDKLTDKATTKATEKTGTKLAEKASAKIVQKTASKTVEKIAVKATEKVVAKTAGKALGKSLLKKIPVLGLAAGLFFAGERAMAGDYAGAGMELASGGASMIPGGGTVASVAIDAALAARDLNQAGVFNSKSPQATVQNGRVVSKTAVAAKSATVSASNPVGLLSAAEYQVKLQIKMVQLMGVSAALLEAILLETDSKPVLSVNGIKLNQQLMVSSLKTMAVNRRDGGIPRM